MKKIFGVIPQLILGLSLLVFTVSCTETPKGVIKKKQAALNDTLDHLTTVGTRVSDQALGADQITLPPNSPVLDLDDIGNYAYAGEANAQLFTVQDLLDPDAQSPVMHLFQARTVWQNVRKMVKDAAFSGSEQKDLQALKGFSTWRYAVVLRARSVQAPRIQSQPMAGAVVDNTTYSTGSFIGGSIEGDALLYDLDDMAFLGGFPFSAHSSENVESTTYGAGAGNEGLQGQLDRDFTEQIKKAVFFGLVDRLPNDRVYMNGNLRQRVMNEKSK